MNLRSIGHPVHFAGPLNFCLLGSGFSPAAGLKSGQSDQKRNFDLVKLQKKQSIDDSRMPIDELRNSFYLFFKIAERSLRLVGVLAPTPRPPAHRA
jgi:hypothetical protein